MFVYPVQILIEPYNAYYIGVSFIFLLQIFYTTSFLLFFGILFSSFVISHTSIVSLSSLFPPSFLSPPFTSPHPDHNSSAPSRWLSRLLTVTVVQRYHKGDGEGLQLFSHLLSTSLFLLIISFSCSSSISSSS